MQSSLAQKMMFLETVTLTWVRQQSCLHFVFCIVHMYLICYDVCFDLYGVGMLISHRLREYSEKVANSWVLI